MILGIGIDIVKVERIREAYDRLGYRFLEKFSHKKRLNLPFVRENPSLTFLHVSPRKKRF